MGNSKEQGMLGILLTPLLIDFEVPEGRYLTISLQVSTAQTCLPDKQENIILQVVV